MIELFQLIIVDKTFQLLLLWRPIIIIIIIMLLFKGQELVNCIFLLLFNEWPGYIICER